MKRRQFIALQQSGKIPRIGYFSLGSLSAYASSVDALRAGLKEVGYVDGSNVIIEFRWADSRPEDFEAAFATAKQRNAQALLALDDLLTFTYRSQITVLAASSRLPAMYAVREYPDAGGLMSYGPSIVYLLRRAATFVDKILKGTNPPIYHRAGD